jgi:hypothetical protein
MSIQITQPKKLLPQLVRAVPPGVTRFSAHCNGGTCLSTLGAPLKNAKLGVTTAGEIRANKAPAPTKHRTQKHRRHKSTGHETQKHRKPTKAPDTHF